MPSFVNVVIASSLIRYHLPASTYLYQVSRKSGPHRCACPCETGSHMQHQVPLFPKARKYRMPLCSDFSLIAPDASFVVHGSAPHTAAPESLIPLRPFSSISFCNMKRYEGVQAIAVTPKSTIMFMLVSVSGTFAGTTVCAKRFCAPSCAPSPPVKVRSHRLSVLYRFAYACLCKGACCCIPARLQRSYLVYPATVALPVVSAGCMYSDNF